MGATKARNHEEGPEALLRLCEQARNGRRRTVVGYNQPTTVMLSTHYRFWWSASVLLTMLALAGATPRAEDPRTILDRVYSVAQAERGESRFKQSCAACHSLVEFAEPALSTRWEGQTLGDMYGFIASSMPEGAAGSLKPEEYASVIAYFLHISGFPVGRDDMPADKDVLKKIGIVSNPK